MFEQTTEILTQIKKEKPLILNITNYVTMDFICNGLLSLGASPVVSQAEEEIIDLLKMAKAVVINSGTLHHNFISLCKLACRTANQFSIPIILDPVGAGASQYRTDISASLINEFDIALIRGNASEIMTLAGYTQGTKGVDNCIETIPSLDEVRKLSITSGSTIIISGKTDTVIDHDHVMQFHRGSALMPRVTGMGCLLSAVIAAFHAMENHRFDAAKSATVFYGICGEIAEAKSQGPGSFRTHFLDTLSFFPDQGEYDKL